MLFPILGILGVMYLAWCVYVLVHVNTISVISSESWQYKLYGAFGTTACPTRAPHSSCDYGLWLMIVPIPIAVCLVIGLGIVVPIMFTSVVLVRTLVFLGTPVVTGIAIPPRWIWESEMVLVFSKQKWYDSLNDHLRARPSFSRIPPIVYLVVIGMIMLIGNSSANIVRGDAGLFSYIFMGIVVAALVIGFSCGGIRWVYHILSEKLCRPLKVE